MTSSKTKPQPSAALADVARMKSHFARQEGGSTPPPAHVRRIESAAARARKPGGR